MTSAALVVANLIVAFVAVSQRWGYYSIIMVYWWEAVIIGFYNLGRMFVVCLFGDPLGKRVGIESVLARLVLAIVLGGFFIVKFGGFAIGLGLMVMAAPAVLAQGDNSNDIVAIADGLDAVGAAVMTAVAMLFLSHGVSFLMNFLGRREFKRSNVLLLLFRPYARMVLMLIVLLLGFAAAAFVPALGRTTAFAVAIVLLKLLVDLASHKFDHRRRAADEE
jgi:hypothetical protein